jgi:hypothetical protein
MKTFGIIGAGLLMTIAAMADTVTSAGAFVGIPGNFYSTQSNSGTGTPFWNNWSVDGGHMNVGDLLTGTNSTGATTNYLGTAGSYLSTGGAGPDAPDFTFLQSAVTVQSTLLYSNVSVNVPYPGVVTEIGLYNVANPNQTAALYTSGTLYNSADPRGIFNNSVTPQAPVTMTDWANYGVYASTCGYTDGTGAYCNTYYSESALNQTADPNHQHFSLFRNSDDPLTFFIGFEATRGLTWQEGYGDFNEVVLKLQTTQAPTKKLFRLTSLTAPTTETPEPASFSILGIGLIALGLVHRRRTARQ